jgi:LytS/YehU family sensor histidine kinase
MNPHFIFNCLNSINWFIRKDKSELASKYLTKFSRLVRAILEHSRHTHISLEKELNTLNIYAELEKIRLNDRFDYEIKIDKGIDVKDILVPPLILQPYVENAIWHGISPGKNGGTVTVEICDDKDFIVFNITDDGVGRAYHIEQRQRLRTTSRGMKISEKRIKQGVEDDTKVGIQVVDLYDQDNNSAGTKVIIRYPKHYC